MRFRLAAIWFLIVSCAATPAPPPLPPASGLEVVTREAILDVSTGEAVAQLRIPDAPIGAVRHDDEMLVIGTRAVWSIGDGDARSVHEFDDPMLHVQVASSDATSVVLVHPAERDKQSVLFAFDGELSMMAEVLERPWLVGVGRDGAILEDRGELVGMTWDGDRQATGHRIDEAVGFAGTNRILASVGDDLEVIDLDGARTGVTGVDDARLSHGVGSPDGSEVIALLTSNDEVDDDNQLRSMGMWAVGPDATATLIDGAVGNDDAIVAIDRAGGMLFMILAEGRPHPQLVARSLADGTIEPIELPSGSVPVDWSLPALSMLLIGAGSA